MGRCGCGTTTVNDTCACVLASSLSIDVTGSGNSGDPYALEGILNGDDGNTLSIGSGGFFTSGMIAATSAERAALTPGAGVRVAVYETDTDLEWVWNGTLWRRRGPKGLLGLGTRDTDYSNATTSYTTVVDTGSVHVPGGRVLEITASWPRAENTAGSFSLAIKRTLDDGSSPAMLVHWRGSGDSTSPTAGAGGQGGTYITHDDSITTEGDYKYYFQARSISGIGGTTVIACDGDYLAEIAVKEI